MNKRKTGPETTVGVTAVGGALGILIVWILKSVGVEVPDTVAGAIATLSAAILGWFVPVSNE